MEAGAVCNEIKYWAFEHAGRLLEGSLGHQVALVTKDLEGYWAVVQAVLRQKLHRLDHLGCNSRSRFEQKRLIIGSKHKDGAKLVAHYCALRDLNGTSSPHRIYTHPQ